ncbi:hypothetical protein H1R20_g3175, partial [Candolleomyces eurysporus]
MQHSGILTRANPALTLDAQGNPDVVFYVYNRSSVCNTTTRLLAELETDCVALSRPHEVYDYELGVWAKAADVVQGQSQATAASSHPTGPVDFTAAVNSCEKCGEWYDTEVDVVVCSLCEMSAHAGCIPIPPYCSEGPEDFRLRASDEDYYYCCPRCSTEKGGAWDEAMLGQFILLDISHWGSPTSKFYPAEIIAHDKNAVSLKLHEFNIYEPTELSPFLESRVVHPQECVEAFTRDSFDYTPWTLGKIKWPVDLDKEAESSTIIKNCPELAAALEDAYPVVFDIARGARDHPACDLLFEWVQEGRGQGATLAERIRATEFSRTRFHLPVLPGDGVVVEEFVLRIWKAVDASSEQNNADPSKPLLIFELVEIVSRVLFLLVAVRVYLGCEPLHDAEVYDLCRRLTPAELAETPATATALRGRLCEHLSVHEKAYYLCQPFARQDEHGNADKTKLPLKVLSRHIGKETRVQYRGIHLSQQIDPSLPALDRRSRLSAVTENDQPYGFRQDPGSNPLEVQSLCLSSLVIKVQSSQPFRIVQPSIEKPPARELRKRNPSVSYSGNDSGHRRSKKRPKRK